MRKYGKRFDWLSICNISPDAPPQILRKPIMIFQHLVKGLAQIAPGEKNLPFDSNNFTHRTGPGIDL